MMAGVVTAMMVIAVVIRRAWRISVDVEIRVSTTIIIAAVIIVESIRAIVVERSWPENRGEEIIRPVSEERIIKIVGPEREAQRIPIKERPEDGTCPIAPAGAPIVPACPPMRPAPIVPAARSPKGIAIEPICIESANAVEMVDPSAAIMLGQRCTDRAKPVSRGAPQGSTRKVIHSVMRREMMRSEMTAAKVMDCETMAAEMMTTEVATAEMMCETTEMVACEVATTKVRSEMTATKVATPEMSATEVATAKMTPSEMATAAVTMPDGIGLLSYRGQSRKS